MGSAASGNAGRGGKPSNRANRKKVAAVEQKLGRHIATKDGAELASKMTDAQRKKLATEGKVFRITGLENSKAANNADHGLKTALEFFERKTEKMGKRIRIIKVCDNSTLYIKSDSGRHLWTRRNLCDECTSCNPVIFLRLKKHLS